MRKGDGVKGIATHPRSYDCDQQIEFAAHLEALVAEKRAARVHRAQDRLHHAAASAKALFLSTAERGAHLGVLTRGLLPLLDSHGAGALEQAIKAALAEDAAHLGAVRHFIDQHARERALPPPIALSLPTDPRISDLSVKPHSLRDYSAVANIGDRRSFEE